MSEPKYEVWDIGELTPHPKNPRQNEEAVFEVEKSIRRYGFNQPIAILKDGLIIAGHTRYKAAKRMGLKEVPVMILDISEKLAEEYLIADNKTHEIAQWDFMEMADLVKTFDQPTLPGFTDDEMQAILNTDQLPLVKQPGPKEESAPVGEHVRMVQLFYNEEEFVVFNKAVDGIKKALKIDNVSEVVIQAVCKLSEGE